MTKTRTGCCGRTKLDYVSSGVTNASNRASGGVLRFTDLFLFFFLRSEVSSRKRAVESKYICLQLSIGALLFNHEYLQTIDYRNVTKKPQKGLANVQNASTASAAFALAAVGGLAWGWGGARHVSVKIGFRGCLSLKQPSSRKLAGNASVC